jgi:hypothetical protein
MLERHVKGNIRIFLTSFKNRCKEDSKNRCFTSQYTRFCHSMSHL